MGPAERLLGVLGHQGLKLGFGALVVEKGDERAWWKATGIDPLEVARELWRQTRLSENPQLANLAVPSNAASLASEEARELRSDQVITIGAGDGRTP